MKREIIYNMPAEEYHALPRLSSSGIKKLLVSSQDFWQSSFFNKNKKEKKSDTFNLGTAYHVRILEGAEVFNKKYAVMPKFDRRTTIGKAAFAQWEGEHPNVENIDEDVYADIVSAAKRVSEVTDLFTGGNSEISILWDDEETGVPMKSRLDYKKKNIIPDLKTFSNSSDDEVDRLLARHIVKYKYYIQSEVYREAVGEECEFNFVFVQTGGINNVLVKSFPHDLLLADRGRRLMRKGIKKFSENYRKFGSNPWYDDYPVVSFTDESFPLYILED